MTDATAAIEVRDVPLGETIDLRGRVLRGHLPGVPARAASDDCPGTWHLGAFRGGRLAGVVTGFAQEAPGRPGLGAQRFRFMAVEPAEQGRGVGTALMAEVIARARSRGDRLLWANGRDTALDFYTGLGFDVVGDSFDDAISHLPHHVVVLEL
jgi:GNAT superfamily N-acetyltransferase